MSKQQSPERRRAINKNKQLHPEDIRFIESGVYLNDVDLLLQVAHHQQHVKLQALEAERDRYKKALDKSLARVNELDIAMNHSAELAQEVWRHHKSELEEALQQNRSGG